MKTAILGATVACGIGALVAGGGVAHADATEPGEAFSRQVQTVHEACSKRFTVDGVEHAYAEHVYPSPATLAWVGRVAVIAHDGGDTLPGYQARVVTTGVFVRDGAVAVDCGVVGAPSTFTSVTLVLPRAYLLDLTDPWNGGKISSSADKSQVEQATERCEPRAGANGGHLFAEHTFALADQATLAGVTVLASDARRAPPGYTVRAFHGVFLHEGTVAADCGAPGGGFESVTFVRPRAFQLDKRSPWGDAVTL